MDISCVENEDERKSMNSETKKRGYVTNRQMDDVMVKIHEATRQLHK